MYTLTVRDVQRVASWLQSCGIDAHAYWGDLDSQTREDLEQRLLESRIKVLVATTALGMGFDKPDLGFVVHFQRPGSVIHYYQQVGRAGRAIDQAYGILLSGKEDQDITEYFITTAFPPRDHIEMVLHTLESADEGLTMAQIESRVNLSRSQIEKTLKVLSVETPSPVTKIDNRWFATPVNYRVGYLCSIAYSPDAGCGCGATSGAAAGIALCGGSAQSSSDGTSKAHAE